MGYIGWAPHVGAVKMWWMGLSLLSLNVKNWVGLPKERQSGILDRQLGEAEYIQGKKEDTWNITRGNFQVRKKRAVRSMIWFTHVLSNQTDSLACSNQKEVDWSILRNRNGTDLDAFVSDISLHFTSDKPSRKVNSRETCRTKEIDIQKRYTCTKRRQYFSRITSNCSSERRQNYLRMLWTNFERNCFNLILFWAEDTL